MAKKRSKDPVSATAKSPTADRHKSRTTISFSKELVALLAQLAERNKRPLYWEARLALEAHLRANGLEPPTSSRRGDKPAE
jgi:hypothetical protein